jgi:pyrimidine-nucleoside phosphorylase
MDSPPQTPPPVTTVDLIRAKRDGHELAPDELTTLIEAYTSGRVPDYQMSAFLMACFLRGMSRFEAAALTRAMLHSGEVLDLSEIPGIKVDKHSTGGVGDKVSLALAPIVAACGVPVPMISGRGLGHTGGTLDKLESIPGFRTDLDIATFRRQLGELGLVMIGQTAEIAPADKKIYALRDVTATVEFIPFIAASIMSKKLAEGIDALVLDVKCGRGAFMQAEDEARRLAETLTDIGTEFGKPTVALLTRMDVPLGRAIGNWPETAEAIRMLHGDVDGVEDFAAVTNALAAEMVVLGGLAEDAAEALDLIHRRIADGSALKKMRDLVVAQGGDPTVIDDPSRHRGDSPAAVVSAPAGVAGYVTDVDARALGLASVRLGAGRATKEDTVDPLAGYRLLKRPGEPVSAGEPIAQIFTADSSRIDVDAVLEAFSFGDSPPVLPPLLIDRLTTKGWHDRVSYNDLLP